MALKVLLADDSTGAKTLSAAQLLTTPTANAAALRDANGNLQVNNLMEGGTSTATAAGTTTLTVSSTFFQQFTGSTTQTVVLPNATTLTLYQSFFITNRSSGVVTVNANGGGLIQTMAAGSQLLVTVTSIGSSAGTWDAAYSVTTVSSVTMRAGSSAIGSAQTSLAVTFSSAMPNTSYTVVATMLNTTDTNPQFQPITITAFSTSGFTAKWNANTDSANYLLNWIATANQ